MKFSILPLIFVSGLCFSPIHAHAHEASEQEHEHKKLIPIPDYSASKKISINSSATTFLQSLDETQKKQIGFNEQAKERKKWSNLPAGMYPRHGLSIGELSDHQRDLVFKFLSSSLSQEGYQRVSGILAAEAYLSHGRLAERLQYYPEKYYLAFFGEPDAKKKWAWQFGGHHLSLYMTIENDKVASISPMFIGTAPAAFRYKEKNYSVAVDMHQAGFDFFSSLSEEQQAKALIKKTPGDLSMGAGNDINIPQQEGVKLTNLTPKQKQLALALIQKWIGMQPHTSAEAMMKEMTKSLPQASFTWKGENGVNKKCYFKLQSPNFIIEFSSKKDGSGKGHYHSIYRNLLNDYGEK